MLRQSLGCWLHSCKVTAGRGWIARAGASKAGLPTLSKEQSTVVIVYCSTCMPVAQTVCDCLKIARTSAARTSVSSLRSSTPRNLSIAITASKTFLDATCSQAREDKLHHVISYLTLSSHFRHALPMQMRSYGLDLNLLFNALQDYPLQYSSMRLSASAWCTKL